MATTVRLLARRVAPSAVASHPIPVRTESVLATRANWRCYSAAAKQFVVINSVGIDRPGIVADVAKIVADKGGNVGESRAQILGGHFSLLMHVEISSSDLEGLRASLRKEDIVVGVSTSCFGSVDPRAVEVHPTVGWTGNFRLGGADHPGLVYKLASVLARNGLTIDGMKTSREDAPYGGTELFAMEGKVIAYEPLASNFDSEKIRTEVLELGESLNCDVELDEVTGA